MTSPDCDPSRIYRYRDAIYAVDMLIAGLHLDLFSRLAAEPSTKADICTSFMIANRPTDVMLTLFTAMGLLENRGGVFHVTPVAREHLVSGSPTFLGPYYPRLEERAGAADLLRVLRTGKPASWGSQSQDKDWHAAMEADDFAESFTAAMDCRGAYLAPFVARAVDLGDAGHLLDIGGGSGIYACTLAEHYPGLRATVLEKPPVDQIAARAIRRRGLSDRVDVIASDMLTAPFPAIADVHLFSNVLHDWDEPVVRALLKKSFDALPDGGRVLVHGAHLDADKTGPLHVAEYSVLLVHASEGRCYSVAEIDSFMGAAGFEDVTFMPGGAMRSVIAATRVSR
jgi:predicted O-methyltransferase YrrM